MTRTSIIDYYLMGRLYSYSNVIKYNLKFKKIELSCTSFVRAIMAMWISSQIITGSMITGIYSHEDDSSVDFRKKIHNKFYGNATEPCDHT